MFLLYFLSLLIVSAGNPRKMANHMDRGVNIQLESSLQGEVIINTCLCHPNH